jgi:hypothetical protein
MGELVKFNREKVAHTLTRQIAIPPLVNVQNNDLWGLGVIPSTGSGAALGNEGTVQNWRATEVGKYMTTAMLASQFSFDGRAGSVTSYAVSGTMGMRVNEDSRPTQYVQLSITMQYNVARQLIMLKETVYMPWV